MASSAPKHERRVPVGGGPGRGFPEAFMEFIRLFNDRKYWDSHEVLEQPWRENRSDFYQGLIIYASAFVHAQRGNPVGIRKQMAKVFGKLDKYRPYYMGIDVDAVLEHAAVCTEFVLANPDLRGEKLTAAVDYRELHPKPQFVRGDEPELGWG